MRVILTVLMVVTGSATVTAQEPEPQDEPGLVAAPDTVVRDVAVVAGTAAVAGAGGFIIGGKVGIAVAGTAVSGALPFMAAAAAVGGLTAGVLIAVGADEPVFDALSELRSEARWVLFGERAEQEAR